MDARLRAGLRNALLTLALVSGGANPAGALPFTQLCPGQDDIDTNPASVVSCVATPALSGTIVDLDVQLEIDDVVGTPYVSDLLIELTHVPSGTTVTLYVGDLVAAPPARLDATLDDEAATPVPTSGDAISGPYQPAGLLSDFDGLDVSGQWDLLLSDESPWTDEGLDLISWSLVADIAIVVPEPATASLVLLGLVGLAARRGARTEEDARR